MFKIRERQSVSGRSGQRLFCAVSTNQLWCYPVVVPSTPQLFALRRWFGAI